MSVVFEILLVLALIVLNGVFAMGELAIVSARRARLTAMEQKGDAGAALAAELGRDPQRFLPTIQVGITLIGILAGAFGGARLSATLGEGLNAVGLAPYGEDIAFGVVVVAITFLSVVIGELVPKQLALRAPERIAARLARPLAALSYLSLPAVWVLSHASAMVLRLMGAHRAQDSAVTEEEVKALVEEGTQAGVLDVEERDMISRVLRLADRPVRAIMTPRNDVDWVDLQSPPEDVILQIKASSHARFIVCDGDIDNVTGVVLAKDVLDQVLDGKPVQIRPLIHKPIVLPDTVNGLDAMEKLRADPMGMALVMDEYGSFEGVVTAADLLEAIVGELAEGYDEPDSFMVRPDGSLLIDGMASIDEVRSRLELSALPAEGTYHTLAGLLLALLRRLPRVGDRIVFDGWRFEVVDVDGRRVDKVLVVREGVDG